MEEQDNATLSIWQERVQQRHQRHTSPYDNNTSYNTIATVGRSAAATTITTAIKQRQHRPELDALSHISDLLTHSAEMLDSPLGAEVATANAQSMKIISDTLRTTTHPQQQRIQELQQHSQPVQMMSPRTSQPISPVVQQQQYVPQGSIEAQTVPALTVLKVAPSIPVTAKQHVSVTHAHYAPQSTQMVARTALIVSNTQVIKETHSQLQSPAKSVAITSPPLSPTDSNMSGSTYLPAGLPSPKPAHQLREQLLSAGVEPRMNEVSTQHYATTVMPPYQHVAQSAVAGSVRSRVADINQRHGHGSYEKAHSKTIKSVSEDTVYRTKPVIHVNMSLATPQKHSGSGSISPTSPKSVGQASL